MKKAVFSYVVLFSLVFPTILLMHTPAAACGREPVTLLEMYRSSDGIYVATFRGIEEGKERREEDGNYSIVDQKKHYDVGATLKGETVKAVSVDDQRYIHHESEPAEPAGGAEVEPETVEQAEESGVEEESESGESETTELKPGDEVLLFVKTDKESGKLELADYVDGVKKLSREDRALYIERIKELKPIFAAKKIDPEKIVDWLVRCAQDAATRWEGTYELQRSFWMQDYRRERLAAGETGVAEPDGIEESPDSARGEYAEAMNEYHRQSLTNILLARGFKTAEESTREGTLVRGDSELISLVSRWGNAHLAGALLDQVRSGAYVPYETAQIMTTIASILKDKTLEALSSTFSDNSYYSDTDIVKEYEPTESEVDPAADSGEEIGEKPVEDEAKPDASSGEKPEEKKVPLTYKDLRARIVEKFVARASALLTGSGDNTSDPVTK